MIRLVVSVIIGLIGVRAFSIQTGGLLSKIFRLNSTQASTTPYTNDGELKDGIKQFYDQSSGIWLDVWGEDMHHGYYPTPDFSDHQAAQRLMIEKSLEFAYNGPFPKFSGKKMVDVGCGVGGSSRYIVKKYGGAAQGLSLSPCQVERANALSAAIGLSHALNYQVADAMNMPFPAKSFDLTWSMESGEHMPDKTRFVNELIRVTKPDGRIIIVTWCHRELKEEEEELQPWEVQLLNKISKAYYLPAWVPASEYIALAKRAGLKDVRSADWSEFVLPFWPAVIRSALDPRNFFRMLRSGMVTVKGAIASFWMRQGLKKGVIKFVIITAKK